MCNGKLSTYISVIADADADADGEYCPPEMKSHQGMHVSVCSSYSLAEMS